MELSNRCPVCQARFRGTRLCSRCGADLTQLMLLSASAWRLRAEARRALAEGQLEWAARYAQEAQAVQGTQTGAALLTLSLWLAQPS